MLEGPQGVVGRIPLFSFHIQDCRPTARLQRAIDLTNKGLDVVLTAQEGIAQGRLEEALIGSPAELQEGGPPGTPNFGASGISKKPGGFDLPYRVKNLIIVIDTSSSMRGGRLPLVQLQIEKLSPHILPGTKVSVITFNSKAEVLINGVEINSERSFKREIVKPIKGIVCEWGTKLDNAFATVLDHIGKLDGYDHLHPERNLISFITDGDHSPSTIEEYRKINAQALRLTPFRNAPIVFIGVGTNYNTDLIQQMAGFAGGTYLHLSSLQSHVFDEQLPAILKEQSGEVFIRVDAFDIERFWSVKPSVQEIPYLCERIGTDEIQGLHELRGGYQNEPGGIAIFDSNEPDSVKYYLAGQVDARLSYGRPNEISSPDDCGKEIPIRIFEDLQPEDRDLAEKYIKRWLKALALDKRDLAALAALQKIDFINQDEHEKLAGSIREGDEEESRSAASEVAVSLDDFGDSSNNFVQKSQSKKADPDFLDKLKDLEKNLPKKAKGQPQSKSFAGSGEHITLHSGALGPLSMLPADSIVPFEGPQPGAAKRYDQAEPIKKPPLSISSNSKEVTIKASALQKKKILIGRNPDSDIVIDLPTISKRHCEIFLDKDIYYIEDLESTNGVYVNGEKIDSSPIVHELKNGDEITIGNINLVIDF